MPLFRSKSRSPPNQDWNESPNRKGSMFSNRSSSTSRSNGGSEKGLFGSVGDSSPDRDNRNGRKRSGRFFGIGRNSDRSIIQNDPSIVAARQKVSSAETAEREADQALAMARNRVREARQHVETLEREALEEARRARMKQAEAKVVRKSAKSLGRHG